MARIEITVSEENKKIIEAAAGLTNRSTSNFVYHCICSYLRRNKTKNEKGKELLLKR